MHTKRGLCVVVCVWGWGCMSMCACVCACVCAMTDEFQEEREEVRFAKAGCPTREEGSLESQRYCFACAVCYS